MNLNPTQKKELQSLQAQLKDPKGGRYGATKVEQQIQELLHRFKQGDSANQFKKQQLKKKHLKRFNRIKANP